MAGRVDPPVPAVLIDPLAPREGDGTRLIVGNLDAELSWAKTALGSHARLPDPVIAAIAAAGAALAVFGRRGDQLLLPGPVDDRRLEPALRDIGVELRALPLPDSGAAGEVLAWGWTAELDALVPGHLDPAIAAEANDRRTSLALESELSLRLPGTELIGDSAAFDRAMSSWPHPAPWVLKAPLSASGRSRLRRRGPPANEARVRVRRLLARFRELVLEPWLPREIDYGSIGTVSGDGVGALSTHRLEVDGNGVFRAIAPLPGDQVPDVIRRGAEAAGARLHQLGYRGPFGVDAFGYRGDSGELAHRPICEINARLTFGHVAAAWRQRLGEHLRFVISRGGEEPGIGAIPLVRPGPSDPSAVFLSA